MLFHYTYYVLCVYSGGYVSGRIFYGVLALLGCVVAFSFSGTLVSFLTVTTYPEPDHLIESLLDWGGHLGTTGGYGSNTYHSIAGSTNPKIRRLADQYLPVANWQEGFSLAREGNYAYMSSKISSEFAVQTQFSNM